MCQVIYTISLKYLWLHLVLDQEERLGVIPILGLFPVRKDFISERVGKLLVFRVKNVVDMCPSDLCNSTMTAEN